MGPRAAFIVIEGLDRSGKSTQAGILHNRLQELQIPSRLVKFPDRTTAVGKMIDAYLRSESELDDHAIHLLFSANRWELASSIEKSLAEGTMVICDRYAFSGIAYSVAKGLPYEWCRASDSSLPAPDIMFFFDITPEQARERGGYGEERYEKEDMQRKVRSVFRAIGEERLHDGQGWGVIDAGQERSKVAEEVWMLVRGWCAADIERPVGKL